MVKWYETDPTALDALRLALRSHYPTLHVRVDDGRVSVHGTLAVLGEEVSEDRYAVKIELPDDYPSSLPSVWETGGRVERVIDRHVFPSTGALCVGVPVDLWLRLRGDFSIVNYIERALRPYLIGNSLVEEGHPWPFRESGHGSYGVLEFYERLLGASDARAVGLFLLALSEGRVRGHWDCPCQSGKPLRKCHGEQVRQLALVPGGWLDDSVQHMINVVNARAASQSSR